jgi:hypothetical protein
MTDCADAVTAFEAAGGRFSLEDGHVKVTYPKNRRKDLMPLLSLLRTRKDAVARLLLETGKIHSAQGHTLYMSRKKGSAVETTITASDLEAPRPPEDVSAARRLVALGDKMECVPGTPAPMKCPPLPAGVQLVRYTPKAPPVAIAPVSIVTDVDKFIQAYITDLSHRLEHPETHGCAPLPEILARLAEVGLELILERSRR